MEVPLRNIVHHTEPVEPSMFPPAVAALFTPRLPALGPGSPNEPMRTKLTAFAFGGSDMARCVHSLLWLHHDFLDESHEISQGIHTPTGSYLHAVMHRREPDAFNSKYWWRRVGSHPVLASLLAQAPQVGFAYTNPFDFVDFCERVRGTNTSDEDLAKQVQLLELQLVLEFCCRAASG
jgi:hypothetical protein